MKFTVETVKRKNRLGLKSADFYLVAVLLIITAGLLAWIQFGVKKQGETVVIKVDGNVVKQLALKNDTEYRIMQCICPMQTVRTSCVCIQERFIRRVKPLCACRTALS